MNFYLSALDEYVKEQSERPSIGLILCKSMKRAVVELAVRDFNKPLGVATYRTEKEIPADYRTLAPVVSGVRRILEEGDMQDKKAKARELNHEPREPHERNERGSGKK